MGNSQSFQINFEGNNRTKSDFLLNVMGIDTLHFNEDELAQGIQRLKNLPILIDASARIIENTKNKEVLVSIEEGLVIWPLVNFGGVEGNRWFLLGVSDYNSGGRAIQSTVFYRNIDGEHNAFLSVAAPYIRGSAIGGGFEIQRYAAIEPLFFPEASIGLDYRYENFTIGGHLSYAFDYQHRLRLGLSYLHEDYTALEGNDLLSTFSYPQLASKDKYLLKFAHDLNRVNFYGYERDGWSFSEQLQIINDLGSFSNPFAMFWMEGKFFQRFRAVNLALRGRVGVSSNEVNPFAPFVLDSQLNIRGAGNRVDRGTAVAVLNTEIRTRVLDTKLLAAQMLAFSDLGNWRKPGGDLDELIDSANLEHFVGLGLRLIYKRSQLATLRIDYGINTENSEQRGIVIGVGQFF